MLYTLTNTETIQLQYTIHLIFGLRILHTLCGNTATGEILVDSCNNCFDEVTLRGKRARFCEKLSRDQDAQISAF